MLRLAGLSVLLIAAVLLPVGTCRAQFSSGEGSYAQLLAKYDRNGNGLLDDRERAALLAPANDQPPLTASLFPLICGGQSAGSADGSSASAEQHSSLPQQMANHVRWPRQQFAENLPQGDPQPNQPNQPNQADQADQAEDALLAEELADGYPHEAPPQPSEPQRQSKRFRSEFQYRMLLNESKVQPRSQPFARAATFGPMVGRSKQQTRRNFGVNVDVGCMSSGTAFYGLSGY